MEIIEYGGEHYPKFQSEGFASRWTFPFAMELLKGMGYDVGCNRLEWKLPESDERTVKPIDITFSDEWHAMNLPYEKVDFIFSSHCLEHLPSYVNALEYWIGKLKEGAVLYLYLPHKSQKYWLPWNNRKHIHSFDGEEIKQMLEDRGMINIFLSGVDLNSSFTIVAEKPKL